MKSLLCKIVLAAIVFTVILPLVQPVFVDGAHADPGDSPNCSQCK
jgi:hypothetical protein